jgi:hypothetical protein
VNTLSRVNAPVTRGATGARRAFYRRLGFEPTGEVLGEEVQAVVAIDRLL